MSGRRALLGLPLLAACAELRTPQALPPAVLTTASGQGGPMRAAIEATAAAFANQGQALQGQPAQAALALARLEALDLEVMERRAWPMLSQTTAYALRTARNENRSALGIAQSAPAPQVITALGNVSARLRAGNQAAAEALLVPAIFEPGGQQTLARLGDLGPLPAAEQASAALAREVRRLDLDGGWVGAGNWWQTGAPGAITDGLGSGVN